MDRNTLFEDEENGDDRAVTPLVFLQEDEDDMDYVPDEDEDEDDDGDEEIPLEELQEAEEDNIATLEAITDLFADAPNDDTEDEDEDEEEPETVRAGTGTNALMALLYRYGRNMGSFGRQRFQATDDENDEDQKDPAGWSREKGGYKDSRVADPRGVSLLRSGEFGQTTPAEYDDRMQPVVTRRIPKMVQQRRTQHRRPSRDEFSRHLIPNTNGTTVAAYDTKAYVGQFSADSSFYYTCCQDFRLHVYDTSSPRVPRKQYLRDRGHDTTMKITSTINGVHGQWTVTDSHLNADNSALIYSSLTPTVYMTNPHDPTSEQIPIHFGGTRRVSGYDAHFALYSCRFSASGTEIIAGGNGEIFVYDLGAMRRSLRIDAHDDDINSCCWADTTSGNVLVSASDDTSLKVWDRRSLGGAGGGGREKPSGVLIGHTEGLTHVAPKGDGRYVISNGKDQVLRLWDLRKMRSHSEWNGRSYYSHENWDYRGSYYPKPRHKAHPLDTSVMQYKGHAVMRTLIRCHFSPKETTGQSYIYSGSSDGLIHIWSLDGRVVQVLDRSKTMPISFDPSAPDPPTVGSSERQGQYRQQNIVRDVSWHTYEPVLMSTAWTSRGQEESSIARHEWKGYGKNGMTIEDVLEKERLHEAEWGGITV